MALKLCKHKSEVRYLCRSNYHINRRPLKKLIKIAFIVLNSTPYLSTVQAKQAHTLAQWYLYNKSVQNANIQTLLNILHLHNKTVLVGTGNPPPFTEQNCDNKLIGIHPFLLLRLRANRTQNHITQSLKHQRNSPVHYGTHMSPPLGPILINMNPIYKHGTSFLKIQFTFPPNPTPSKRPSLRDFRTKFCQLSWVVHA